jgi:diaminohydroxyphosphoribosylaminopyrimidine deaminase/5-amino-6-(5-phosphoribosylamino)uracil reductase
VCYTRNFEASAENTEWKAMGDDMSWNDVFADLFQMGVGSVMVEGGAAILESLISNELWDEARIFVGDNLFGSGISAPKLPLSCLNEKLELPDTLYLYINRKSNG